MELHFHNLRNDLTDDELQEWLRSCGCHGATAVSHVSLLKPEGFLLPSDILLIFLLISGTTRVLAGRLPLLSPPPATGIRSSAPRAGVCYRGGSYSTRFIQVPLPLRRAALLRSFPKLVARL